MDFLNGEVVWRGHECRVPTPLNRLIVDTIRAIARREIRPGLAALRHLYQDSRARLDLPPPGARRDPVAPGVDSWQDAAR